MANNFIFLGSWYDKLAEEIKDEEQRKDFAWRVIKYGATGELELTDNDFANAWLKTICEYVTKKQEDYEQKKIAGRTAGRTQSYERDELRELIAAGAKAQDIANRLGVTKDAIYHDPVWKERKANNFYRNLQK